MRIEEAGMLQAVGLQRVRYNLVTEDHNTKLDELLSQEDESTGKKDERCTIQRF